MISITFHAAGIKTLADQDQGSPSPLLSLMFDHNVFHGERPREFTRGEHQGDAGGCVRESGREQTGFGRHFSVHLDAVAKTLYDLRQADLELLRQQRKCRTRRTLFSLKIHYFSLARVLRNGTSHYLGSRAAGVLVGTALIGGLFVATCPSLPFALFGLLVGAAASATVVYYPPDDKVIEESRSSLEKALSLQHESEELAERRAQVKSQLSEASKTELLWKRWFADKQHLAFEEHRRRQLLQRDWKSLRSVPFEQYLEGVFRELGYTVETTKVTGDQGADLILSREGHRIAVQEKGYFNSVSNAAVQEAHAATAYYNCRALRSHHE